MEYWPAPSAALFVLGFVVLALASTFPWRGGGYLSIAGALVVGLLIYFLNGALGDVRVGPIPKGTPVNLLANVNPDADAAT